MVSSEIHVLYFLILLSILMLSNSTVLWSLVRRPRKLLPCAPLINWFVASVNYYRRPPVLYTFSLMRWHPLYTPKVFFLSRLVQIQILSLLYEEDTNYQVNTNLEMKILMIFFHETDYVRNYLFTLKSCPLTVRTQLSEQCSSTLPRLLR